MTFFNDASKAGLLSLERCYLFKIDYRKLFDWYLICTCYSHRLCDHNNYSEVTDDKQEWVLISVLKKNIKA